MPVPIVIDLSHHNTIPESLLAAKQAGIIGVIHKATEGASYVDEMVDNRFYLAKQAGMLWGLYHFMRPGNMKQQASFFVDVARKNGDEHTLLAADHEDTGVSLNDLKVWLKEVERLTGRKPAIYSGHVLKQQLGTHVDPELSTYLLWLAQYATKPTLPPGFASAWLWQYTDAGTVPGVKSPVDLNAGNVEVVKKQWAGSGEPAPIPEPGEPEVLVEVNNDDGVGVITLTMTPSAGVKVTLLVNGKPV